MPGAPYDIVIKEYGTNVAICTLTIGLNDNRDPSHIIDENDFNYPTNDEMTVYDLKQMISRTRKYYNIDAQLT